MENFINEILTFLSPLGVIAFFVITTVRAMKKKEPRPDWMEEEEILQKNDDCTGDFSDFHNPPEKTPVPNDRPAEKRPFATTFQEPETEEEEETEADFDLRQAIISSEILKRPEF